MTACYETMFLNSSYNRLLKLLACYDPKEKVMLGERYGFAVSYKNLAYSYPTGGGG